MTSGHESGFNPDNEPARHHGRPASASTEAAYEQLSAYGFARRYAQGKTVADLGHAGAGYGSRLLAQSAESLTALADLPKPPLPDGSFDVVVAFGAIEELEHPEELVEEAKRLLKEGGVLLVSVADRRAAVADGRRGGMYVPEFRGLLERHFGHVRLYRQGAVAGGFVFPVSGELTAAVPVESVRLSSGGPRLGGGPPTTRSVMAVCTDAAEVLREEERAYLLVDRDGYVFDECEERAEDVELMLGEIRRMQETEVQAYQKAMNAQRLPLGALLRLIPQVLLYYLYDGQAGSQEASRRRNLARDVALEAARRRRDVALEDTRHRRNLVLAEISHRRNVTLEHIIHRWNIIRGNVHALRQKDARGLAKGAFRRLSALYRWLRGGQRR
jgi:SAM-dependent methyltransferase